MNQIVHSIKWQLSMHITNKDVHTIKRQISFLVLAPRYPRRVLVTL